MKNILYLICISCIMLSCGSSESDNSTENNSEVSENPSTEENNDENTSSSNIPDPDQDPCELLNLDVLATTLGLQADQITLENDSRRGMYCSVKTSEFNIEGYKTIQVVYLDKMVSKDGRPNFEKMMQGQIDNNAIRAGKEDVPTRKVDGIGNLAFIYSKQDFSTLVYHFNNEIRYTLTLRRDMPENDKVHGLKMSTEELEEKLLELAKKMH